MYELMFGKIPTTSFVKRRNLPNLMGRINYISNPKRQEFLGDFFDIGNKEYWKQLAKQSKDLADYNKDKVTKKGKPFKTIQAVEYVVRLSPDLYDVDSGHLLITAADIANSFYQKFGYKCCVAIHHSKLKNDDTGECKLDKNGNYLRNNNNLHCHLILCDREDHKVNIKKYAKRDIYYDAKGKRVYKKELAVKTIKKGECYSDVRFGP